MIFLIGKWLSFEFLSLANNKFEVGFDFVKLSFRHLWKMFSLLRQSRHKDRYLNFKEKANQINQNFLLYSHVCSPATNEEESMH